MDAETGTRRGGPHPDVDPGRATAARAAFVARLVKAGVLDSPEWRRAFADVPRHRFVPRFLAWRHDGRVVVDGADPRWTREWLRRVYSDEVLVTQADARGNASSSSTQPSLMAAMLHALDVHSGQRVLEIGTGTGYNAALLCHRLGADAVTTVDVDADVVELARARLADAGYAPRVVCGDGALGHAEGAPFDRILATCCVPAISPEWLRQCAPDGLIVTSIGEGVLRLRVRDGVGIGAFLPLRAVFMSMRRPAAGAPDLASVSPWREVEPGRRFDDPEFGTFARLALPAISMRRTGGVLEFSHPASGSALLLADGQVSTGGDYPLWRLLVAAHDWWTAHGRPPTTALRVIADPGGTHVFTEDADDHLTIVPT